ncbi:hypothetical protein GJ744_006189 [Endocarpon pusillum]|uniref:Rhodopsin domain-containing protein n=1 Tax=Endocarpon pusillum TaxID=364733 RepID=A0A8H7APD5_9EURO|nr:hypothetical protein GJ744_006189 [Endocarpon pusillum]
MDLSKNIPALPPPDGVQSQFDHPRTLASSLIAVNATFLPLMIIAVGTRLYTRTFIANALGWDDYTCVGAALSSTAYASVCILVSHWGVGTHLWDIRAITLTPPRLRIMSSLSIIYVLGILFTKISIFLLYLRIFVVRRNFTAFVKGGMVFFSIYHAAALGLSIAYLTKCDRPSTVRDSFCAKWQSLDVFQAVMNVSTDTYLLVLPIAPVMQLQIPQGKKLGVLMVFLCGFIALAVSIARLIAIGVNLHSPDGLYYAALSSSLTAVELNVGIVTASMVIMPQFFTHSKILHLSTYKAVRYRFLRRRTNSSGRQQNPSSKTRSDDGLFVIETNVLGSIQGDGRFIMTNVDGSLIRPMSFQDNTHEHLAPRRDVWGPLV